MSKRINLSNLSVSKLFLLFAGLILLAGCGDSNCIKGEGAIETRTLNLEPFSRIESNGDFKVYLVQGKTQKVEVKGQPNILDQLSTNISRDTWKITHEECVRNSKGVEVFITLPVVASLYVNGSGFIEGEGDFTATDLEVSVNGSGRIALTADASKVISRISGSGKIILEGSAPIYSTNISGSGRAESYNLDSENVSVTISGSGIAEVSAATALNVAITGSGIVYYKGSPTINQQISGSGKVVRK